MRSRAFIALSMWSFSGDWLAPPRPENLTRGTLPIVVTIAYFPSRLRNRVGTLSTPDWTSGMNTFPLDTARSVPRRISSSFDAATIRAWFLYPRDCSISMCLMHLLMSMHVAGRMRSTPRFAPSTSRSSFAWKFIARSRSFPHAPAHTHPRAFPSSRLATKPGCASRKYVPSTTAASQMSPARPEIARLCFF